ncbi:MAG: AAA family ATPase [Desulfobacteraceae bacterium]|nr:AAA family ATPase [Desulfobacteraceae bacterium]
MVDDPFYAKATQSLMSSLKIEKSFHRCLLAIQNEIPAKFLSLHLFDPGLGIIETVVDATINHSLPVSQTTTLSAQARKLIEESTQNPAQIQIIDDLSTNEMGHQLGFDLDTPNSAAMAMDLCMDDEYLGFVALTNTQGEVYSDEHAAYLKLLHDPMALCAAHYHRYSDLVQLKESLTERVSFFQKELLEKVDHEIIGSDQGLKEVMGLCRKVSGLDTPVLIYGETGVGKELFATAIHRGSSKKNGPYIKVNCGGIPQTLLESELFGHEKGAFTGAVTSRPGYFERADKGTIFLDEVGELPLEAQTKFLRVLQDKVVERLGGEESKPLDIRVIAATHRNLEAMVQSGKFRQDLFFRLNVFPITIPPLRDRKYDIASLTRHFIQKKSKEMGLADLPKTMPGSIDHLMDYPWPGNVRELENMVEKEIILARDNLLTFSNFRKEEDLTELTSGNMSLDKAMTKHIKKILNLTHGRVEGKGGAAELMDIHPRTLQSRMKKRGIAPGGKKNQT